MFNWLTGYKSIIGIIGAVATFVLVCCNALADGFQFADVEVLLGAFSALMLAFGLTAKAIDIQKSIALLKK